LLLLLISLSKTLSYNKRKKIAMTNKQQSHEVDL